MNPILTPEKLIPLVKQALGTDIGKIDATGLDAVVIEPPFLKVPCTGIRAVIGICATPIGERLQLSQSTSLGYYEWTVTLTQFDVSEAGFEQWARAIEKMRNAFQFARETPLGYSESTYPRWIFRINEPISHTTTYP